MIKLYNMEVRQALKQLPNESVSCVMTSPPYWALRDYGKDVETIWDEREGCEHKWLIGKPAGDSRIETRSENRAGWERPSREAFASRDINNICPVCNKEFEGKPNQKFCSIECLNTLSNEERTNTKQSSNFCSLCSAWKGQLGLEPTFDLYIKHLCDIFNEVKRVLRKDGTCWVNLGDSYSGNMGKRNGWTDNKLGFEKQEAIDKGVALTSKNKFEYSLQDKSLCNIPARFSIEMQNRGWILRNVIIWHKPNCMPSSVKDRFTVDFEYLFFFVKSKKYFFETQYDEIADSSKQDKRLDKGLVKHQKGKTVPYAMQYAEGEPHNRHSIIPKQDLTGNPTYTGFNKRWQESQYAINGTCINSYGRNKRAVWTITTKPFKEAHFATYPEELCYTPIKAGCPEFICNKCGKAREKIFERPDRPFVHRNKKDGDGDLAIGGEYQKWLNDNPPKEILTSCSCNVEFSGGIVLDPFAGSGTTLKVARDLHRDSIGIEIKKEYCDLIFKRLYNGNKPLNEELFKLIT